MPCRRYRTHPGLARSRFSPQKQANGLSLYARHIHVPRGAVEALRVHLLGPGVEAGHRSPGPRRLLQGGEQRRRHAARAGLRADVHPLDFRHTLAEAAQPSAGHRLVALVADEVGAAGRAQLRRRERRVVETAGCLVGAVELGPHGGQQLGGRGLLGVAQLEADCAHATRSGCSALAMRGMPSRQGTVVGPASSCMRVVSICTLSMVCSVGSKRASTPTSPAR